MKNQCWRYQFLFSSNRYVTKYPDSKIALISYSLIPAWAAGPFDLLQVILFIEMLQADLCMITVYFKESNSTNEGLNFGLLWLIVNSRWVSFASGVNELHIINRNS